MVERLIVAHLREHNEPTETFVGWPLHVSILPWFTIDQREAMREMSRVVRVLRACNISLGARVLGPVEDFGNEDEQIPVRTIQNSTQLGVIHGALLGVFASKLEDRTWVGGRYNPHMTIRDNPDPGEGYEFMLDSISLVRHGGAHKLVVETFDLET